MAAAIGLFSLSDAASAQTIDTASGWDGSQYIYEFGVPDTATYGQTITPTASQYYLNDFTFYLGLDSGMAPRVQAFVYEFNPTTQLIVGAAVYQSAVFTTPSSNAFSPVTIATGGVILVPGTQYVLFLTTSTVAGQPSGLYRWGAVGDTYAGGTFVYSNNGTDFASLATNAWTAWLQDLAFIVTFGAPPPPPPPRPVYGPLNDNQRAVANSLLSYFDANGALPAAFTGLNARDLTVLSGEIATAAISSGLHSAELFMDQISDPWVTGSGVPLPTSSGGAIDPIGYSQSSEQSASIAALNALGADAPTASEEANLELAHSASHSADPVSTTSDSRWRMWGAVYGGSQEIDGDSDVGSSDLTTRNWGVVSGFDYSLGDGRIGLALGGAGSSFELDNGLGSGHAGVFNAGVYGSKAFGNAYVSAAAAYAWNDVDTSRSVGGDELTASYHATTLSGRLEGGYRFDTALAAVIPYAAVQGSSYFMPDYSESSDGGGAFALEYDSQTESLLRTELGARLEHLIQTSGGGIKLSGRLAWAYYADRSRSVSANFETLAAPGFSVDGAEPARNSLLVDAGAEFGLASNMSAKVSFDGEFSSNVAAYGASAKLSYRW